MTYTIGPRESYADYFPDHDPPIQIGHFSTENENKFYDDDRNMKYLLMPKKLGNLHFNLNEGYTECTNACNNDEQSFNKLLQWIISHKNLFTDEGFLKNQAVEQNIASSSSSSSSSSFSSSITCKQKLKKLIGRISPSHKKSPPYENSSPRVRIHFICDRSVLTTISNTLYEKSSDWLIYATKFRSVIYLCKIDTKKQLPEADFLNENKQQLMIWDYNFKQYITKDCVKSKPSASGPANVNEKYFSVKKGTLYNHNILFSAEIDSVDRKYFKDWKSMDRTVTIKTSSVLDSEEKELYFRKNLLKWYLESFIAGIPKLVCGFRNTNGIVKEIKVYNVCDLPYVTLMLWFSDSCLNFAQHFLSHIKQCVVKDDPRVVYKFYWRPEESVTSTITCEELSPEHQLLPEWYIREMMEL